jgi:hypothetical protein
VTIYELLRQYLGLINLFARATDINFEKWSLVVCSTSTHQYYRQDFPCPESALSVKDAFRAGSAIDLTIPFVSESAITG